MLILRLITIWNIGAGGVRYAKETECGGAWEDNVSRIKSETGYYHVVTRGNGRQLIFENDADREQFLSLLKECMDKEGIGIIAWCLMANHVHLVLYDQQDGLSASMQRLLAGYARRFNARTGHVGHVFSSRFSSSSIESERYLLEAVRYVHLNPEISGMCLAPEYRWSSYGEYVGVPVITDTSIVLDMVGGPEGFARFCGERSDTMAGYNPVQVSRTQDELLIAARSILDEQGFGDPLGVKTLSKERRDAALALLLESGLSIRAIERLTGVGRGAIACAVGKHDSQL